jgi:hypothetical protein
MDLDPHILTAVIGAVGGLIGGIISLVGVKLTADNQSRERREKLLREAAVERLERLYEPLLNFMTAGAPYDGLDFDQQACNHIIKLIEKNKRYATPDLLNVFGEFQFAYQEDFSAISRGLDLLLYNTVSAEYTALKDLLGYGPILKQPSKPSRVFRKVKSRVRSKLENWRNEYRWWRRRRAKKR